jgi:hypothetical protein
MIRKAISRASRLTDEVFVLVHFISSAVEAGEPGAADIWGRLSVQDLDVRFQCPTSERLGVFAERVALLESSA